MSFGPNRGSLTVDIAESGEYIVEVRPTANTPGSYTLEAELEVECVRQIALDSNTEDALSGQGNQDVFTFDGTAGMTVNAAYGTDDIAGRVYIFMYAPDGTRLNDFNHPPAHYGETGVLTLPADGTYDIVLEALDSDSEGAYTLGLSEIEPPTPVTLTSPYFTESGTVDIIGDHRYYRFEGTAGRPINAAINTPATLAATLRLRKPGTEPFYARQEIGKVDVHPLNERTRNGQIHPGRTALPQTGAYIIEIDPSRPSAATGLDNLTGPYEVRVFAPEAAPATLDTEISGTVEPIFAFDRYRFDAPASEAFTVHTRSSFSGCYLYTRLYGPDGTELGSERTCEQGRTEVGPLLTGAGPYTVEQDGSGMETGDYRFYIVTIEAPVELLPADPEADGEIDVPGERDYYTFTGAANETVTLALEVPGGSALEGEVFLYSLRADGDFTRADGTPLIDGADFSPGSPVSREVTLPAAGTYIVQVDGTALHGDSTGAYTVGVE